MMREWDVPGRCCAGRGWWCAMAWIFFVMGFTHPQPNFAAIWGLCWYNFKLRSNRMVR